MAKSVYDWRKKPHYLRIAHVQVKQSKHLQRDAMHYTNEKSPSPAPPNRPWKPAKKKIRRTSASGFYVALTSEVLSYVFWLPWTTSLNNHDSHAILALAWGVNRIFSLNVVCPLVGLAWFVTGTIVGLSIDLKRRSPLSFAAVMSWERPKTCLSIGW